MEKIFLIDAIAPFFKRYQKRRINWSKIPYAHLKTEGSDAKQQWSEIEAESLSFGKRVAAIGYNAVTLDDLAHLSVHPKFEPKVQERNQRLGGRMRRVMALHREQGLEVYLTSDVIFTSPAIDALLGDSREELEEWYEEVIAMFFADFPEVSGLVLRIGESDGLDVSDVWGRISSLLCVCGYSAVSQRDRDFWECIVRGDGEWFDYSEL